MRISEWSSDVCYSDLGVGTDQPRCRSPVLLADARAAGAAGVVEGADHAIGAADDHRFRRADTQRQEVTGLGHLAGVPGEQPFAVVDERDVEVEDSGIAVEALGQGMARAAGRSEERRVGKECVSTFRYRGSPYL